MSNIDFLSERMKGKKRNTYMNNPGNGRNVEDRNTRERLVYGIPYKWDFFPRRVHFSWILQTLEHFVTKLEHYL